MHNSVRVSKPKLKGAKMPNIRYTVTKFDLFNLFHVRVRQAFFEAMSGFVNQISVLQQKYDKVAAKLKITATTISKSIFAEIKDQSKGFCSGTFEIIDGELYILATREGNPSLPKERIIRALNSKDYESVIEQINTRDELYDQVQVLSDKADALGDVDYSIHEQGYRAHYVDLVHRGAVDEEISASPYKYIEDLLK